LPRWILGFGIARRRKKFSNQFTDAIDMIVRGIKSGLPLNECMHMIGRESSEPLRGEFERVMDSLQMGATMERALEKLYKRMPLSEVNFFAIVIMIQQQSGGNLSEALGNLAGVLRGRKMLGEKVKALTGEAQASAFIIGFLPIGVMVLVYLTSPEYMTTLFVTETGQFILLIGAGLMAVGIFVMRKMMNFDH
jgi:tight adherence protein B